MAVSLAPEKITSKKLKFLWEMGWDTKKEREIVCVSVCERQQGCYLVFLNGWVLTAL